MLPQGDHLFKRLSLDETLTRVWDVYCKGFLIFIKISFVVLLLSAFMWSWVLLPALRIVLGVSEDMLLSESFTPDSYFVDSIVLGLLHTALETLLSSIAQGGIVLAVALIYAGEEEDDGGSSSRLNWFTCFKDGGMQNALTLLLATLFTGVGVVAGILFFWVPGVILMVYWFVVNPCIVLDKSPSDDTLTVRAIRKSQELVEGSWCYCFCTVLIGFAMVFVVKIFWIVVVLQLLFKGFLLYTFKGALLMVIPMLFALPILSILQTVMYFNLRVEKEGMNFEALLRDLGHTTEHGSYRQVSLLETLEPSPPTDFNLRETNRSAAVDEVEL